jgi:two-component system response regulator RstA
MNQPTEKLPRILIVEDDERLATLTQEYLIRNGMEVGIETDGNRAIRRIISDQPDLVVLDVMLPGADGLSVCREDTCSRIPAAHPHAYGTNRRFGSSTGSGNGCG